MDAYDRIIASLHDTTLGTSHWRETSTLIDQACEMAGTHLVILDDAGRNPEWVYDLWYCHGEHAAEWADDYMRRYFPHDERIARLMRLPDSRIVPMADLYSESEVKTSPTYNDALTRYGSRGGVNMRMDLPDGTGIYWATCDSLRGKGWTTAQIDMIARLLPHVRHFVRVRQALAASDARSASITELLANDLIGVLYLDRRGRIIEANSHVRLLLRMGDGLWDQDGLLRARSATDDAALQKLLAGVFPRSHDAAVGGSLTIGRGPSPRLVLHVTPMAAPPLHFGAPVPAALVLIVNPASTPPLDPALIASIYGLTHAESLVAAALAEGKSVRAIAAETHRQESSVRWLVKQIHHKLGISRQVDLVRMVLATRGTGLPPT